MKTVLPLLLCLPFSVFAIDGYYFGFDTNSADNYAAFASLEAYANATTNRGVSLSFVTGGVYNVTIPGSGACDFVGCTNISIDASNVEFYCTNLSASGQQWIFSFTSCTNVTLNAAFRGEHTSTVNSGVKSVYLIKNNTNFTITVVNNGMYDGCRIGNFEDPVYGASFYHNNDSITVNALSTNTYYSVPCYLANHLTINSTAIGTPGNYGGHRNIYISGCSDVTATGYSRDLNVPDHCYVISSAPSYDAPQHRGCTNVTLHATDLGTTNYIAFQNFVGIGTVSSTVSNTSIVQSNINVTIDLHSTDTVWTNNNIVVLTTYGSEASNQFYVTVSGTNDHSTLPRVNTKPAVYAYDNGPGLGYIKLVLTNFYDYTLGTAPTPTSIRITYSNTVANIDAYKSEIHNLVLSNPDIQSYTNHGYPRPPGAYIRLLRSP